MAKTVLLNPETQSRLKAWETQTHGHEERLQDDINEINSFIDDSDLNKVNKEKLQKRLVDFLINVC